MLLCAALLCQMAVPASAAETGASAQETQPTEQQAAQIPFGRVCIDNGCRTLNGMRPLAGSDSRLDTALAAFAYETNTETVIYSYNPDTKLPTGTLAKIVTALVAIENSNLDDIVTCSDGIQSKVPGSSLKMKPNLKSGEQLTVNDLLHALLMIGANDAAVALAEHHDLDLPYCFNRKEAKDHGEGGNLVGSALQGRVMLVDDVITAGTAIRESMEIIQANGATLAGVLISLDRQERGRGEISAIQEVERDYNCKVISIITLKDLIAYLEEKPEMAEHLAAVKAYREEFGV